MVARRWTTLLAALTLSATAVVTVGEGAVASDPPPLQILAPGQVGFVAEAMPLNVVFVGYQAGTGPREVDPATFLAEQLSVTAGIARYPVFFDVLRPTYTLMLPDYRLTFADDEFEDAFFDHLAGVGTPMAGPTFFQRGYNQQPGRRQTVVDPIAIDAAAVEQWLADEAPSRLGIDTSQPTVFFVDWFGRADFRFHVYTRLGTTDTDTGLDSGRFDSRGLIAWGGTPAEPGQPASRVWFHDLSSGPEFNTENWDLTTPDVDGDGVIDYRMPPSWEYGSTVGYRPFTDLSGDLGKLLRYVFVDLLLVPSPIYEPTISAPRLPSDLSVDITRIVAAGIPHSPVNTGVLRARLAELQPWNTFGTTERTIQYTGRLRDVTRCWATGWDDPTGVGETCLGRRGGGFAFYDLFLYLRDHLLQFSELEADHSVPTLLYEVPDSESLSFARALAEPNFYTGEQSHVVSFSTPFLQSLEIGQTDTLVHELGHHLGMSHPHDGLDFERGIQFFPTGEFFYAWVGDESSTVMSYLSLANDFSQFERDSMGRWMTAAYLNQSNQVLARLLASPRAGQVHPAVVAADADALAALAAYSARDYEVAARLAKRAYDGLVAAGETIGVRVEPQSRAADVKAMGRSDMFVDPIPPINGQRVAPGRPGASELPVQLTVPSVPSGSIWVPVG